MKINNFKINGFGKIINKDVNLNEKVNVIYGKNEAGKSTLLNFINCMFYGAAKTKNGKDISDFDKYKPWKTEDYSGKIKYTLDDGNIYEVYREFKKKSPVIYNDKLQDISGEFVVDKTKGIDFLSEQITIDEDTFINTVITNQNEIRIEKVGQNAIIQKISNLVSSGDESVSFKKTLDKISKTQIEQVGSDRTSQKPINMVNLKIISLEKEKVELEEYKEKLDKNTKDLEEFKTNLIIEENKLNILKELKNNLEENNLKIAEIDVNRKIQNGYSDKVEELEQKVDRKAKDIINKEKKSFKGYFVSSILLLIIAIVVLFIKSLKVVGIVLAIIAIIIFVLGLLKKNTFNKEKKEKLQEIDELELRIKQEIEILNRNKIEQEVQISQKENELNSKTNSFNELLMQRFLDKLDRNFIETVLEMNLEEVLVSISNKEERINNLKFEIQTISKEKSEMDDKIDTLSKIQEELDLAIEEKNEIQSLNNSFNIAKECIESAYEKVRDSLNPIFTKELCNIVSKISNDKYKNIKFSDTDVLTVEIDDGRYMSVERLSVGTIDQMYLALRLSSINTISDENMPIILDESFAFFDDERLGNILKFIIENYPNKQIIILTCSNREKDVLENLKIQYNLIELEK